MNKQELIERIECLKNVFGNKNEYVKIDFVVELISELDEPHKVVVPQFVADWYEENNDGFEGNLYRYTLNIPSTFDGAKLNEFERWFLNSGTKPFQTLVNMHQFGYEVEKEPKYIVKLKNVRDIFGILNFSKLSKEWRFSDSYTNDTHVTTHIRKELEEAGFGWVFDCEGIEVEEVTE